MMGHSKTVSSSLRTAPLRSAIAAIALDTLPRRAKVGEIADIVLRNMTPEAAPPLRTPLPTLAATARASTLLGQGCALYEQLRPAEQAPHMLPGLAYTRFQLSLPLTPLAPPPPPPTPQPSTLPTQPALTQALGLVRNPAPINGKRARANSTTHAQNSSKKNCAPYSSPSTSLVPYSTPPSNSQPTTTPPSQADARSRLCPCSLCNMKASNIARPNSLEL